MVLSKESSMKDLTDAELKIYGKNLWPVKPVDDVEELIALLDCNFFSDDDDGPDTDEQWENFSSYTRKVGGWGWLNALHPLNGKDEPDETPLTYVLGREPEEWRFISFLLQMGADANVRNGKGQPPLFVFIASGSPMRRMPTFQLLTEYGANDKAAYGGKTMIQFAELFKKNDPVNQIIWDDMKEKHGISDDDRFFRLGIIRRIFDRNKYYKTTTL